MLGLQVVFAVCLFVFVALSYLIPVIVTRVKLDKTSHASRQKIRELVSICCNCTSAGVFIAMFFLALLPNVRKKLVIIFQQLEITTSFPTTECLVVGGYFLTLCAQQMLLSCQKKHTTVSNSLEQEQCKSLLNEFELENLSPSSVSREEINFASLPDTSKSVPPAALKKSLDSHVQNKSQHSHLSALTESTTCLNFVVLMIAISVHAFFEGATLALQTTTQNAVHLFIAILMHECLVSLALGMNSALLKLPVLSIVKFAMLFSLALPAGVGIGLALGQTPGITGDIVSAVVQGLAAGIFLHVTFQELIPSEFNVPSHRLLKLLFLFLGFVFFALVTFYLIDK